MIGVCARWLLLALSMPALAQSAAPDQSTAPDNSVPQANPARPTVTNPATFPPVGYLQFEQGFVQANESPGVDRQFSINQVTKIAVHSRLMMQFQSQPFAATFSSGMRDNAEGDLDLGGQVICIPSKGKRPTLSLGYLQRVRSGDAADLDIGSFSRSAVLLASGDLGGFHYDSNFVVSEQQLATARRAQYGETLSVSHPLWGPNWGLSAELWRFSQPFVTATYQGRPHARSNAAATLWAIAYTARPNLVLDAGFDHGLTSTSTQWQGFAGFTYVLPHRLWRRHEAPPVTPPKHS